MVHRDLKAHRVILTDLLARRARRVPKAVLAPRVIPGHKVQLVCKVLQVLNALQDLKVQQVLKALLVLLDLRAHRAQQVPKAILEH